MNSEVSIVIPCYNSAKYIKECVYSCINQTYTPAIVICVNDGSSDNTLETLSELKMELGEILLIKNQENLGACAARNSGLLEVKTRFVQFLDADDILLPSKLEKDLNLMVLNKGDLLVGSYEKIGLNGESIGLAESSVLTNNEIWHHLVLGNLGITSCNLFNTHFLRKNEIAWDTSLKSSQEYKFMFEILKNSPQVEFSSYINTKVIRRDLQSISSKNGKGNVLRWLQLRQEILSYLKDCNASLHEEIVRKAQSLFFDRVRILAKYDLDQAIKLKNCLVNPNFSPQLSANNTKQYIRTYKLLGFKGAELVKKWIK